LNQKKLETPSEEWIFHNDSVS